MDDPEIVKLLKELLAVYAAVNPLVEGLNDYTRLNILQVSKPEVSALLTKMTHRRDLLDAAAKALQALVEDGYPELPSAAVSGEIYADLAEQTRTLSLAFKQFRSADEAVIAIITPSTPEPK